MLFNSLEFALFLPIVFAIYWIIGSQRRKWQNLLIVAASYFFYGWWDWRFLGLIAISTLVDYLVGIGMDKSKASLHRKSFLLISISVNIGILAIFKYYNFFAESFTGAFKLLGTEFNLRSLRVILPVGISFYTFQTLSYSIDVYRREIKATEDLVSFAAFVSFFPQLVAGPIERAKKLLPQFESKRLFNYQKSVDGLRQILLGLFKKIVIADSCALYVEQVFSPSADYNGSTILMGAFLFAFQIYGDFSGYSDIAIGTARLFGFNLMRNFAYPYFSRDIAEFWRRWHISLSTWFRDYIYIPLGGSKVSNMLAIRNIFIIFIISGLWHGANWTFVAWGIVNASLFLPLFLLKKNRSHTGNIEISGIQDALSTFSKIGITFLLTCIAWIFFRADTINQALEMLQQVFSASLFQRPAFIPQNLIILIMILIGIEWFQRNKEHALILDWNIPKPARYFLYYTMIAVIFFHINSQQEFIYFQF